MSVNKSREVSHTIYNQMVLTIYDLWVLGFSNHYLWRCPTARLREVFASNASDNHLDIGVGTGYYPDHCLSSAKRRLALLDINTNCLQTAALRVSRFQPEVHCANILQPLSLACQPFDSISLQYILHCLPGSLAEKSVVFDHIKPYLAPGGILFGSTILAKGIEMNALAKKVSGAYNRKGIFNNIDDDFVTLDAQLKQRFEHVDIQQVGCVAIFRAKTSSVQRSQII